jgi:hypothetical protein
MENKSKTFKIGTLRTGTRDSKDDEGNVVQTPTAYLALGDLKNSDVKYNHTVEITVKDHTGKVVHKQENGFITLEDPRKGRFPKPNTPAFIKYELKVSSSNTKV